MTKLIFNFLPSAKFYYLSVEKFDCDGADFWYDVFVTQGP